MKTLIELFDPCQIKNVIAGLTFKPQKIVFVGFKQNMKQAQLNSIEKFFRMKNIDVTLEYEYVSRYNYASIVERLNEIIDRNGDCCFDLTGGKELVLVAMGEISAKREIPMFQFDLKGGGFIHVNNCEEIQVPKTENISIEECITLNGGAIVRKNAKAPSWDMSEDFCRDIYLMWNICRNDTGAWNSNSASLGALEKNGSIDKTLSVSGKIKETVNQRIDPSIMKALEVAGVVSNVSFKGDVLTFRYKNEQIRQCLIKAGNILELLIYMLAREISAEERGFYNDIDVGVMVDWDGVIHEDIGSARDTRNEIDVFLMHGQTPVFISCKNGVVQKEALYELEAVADKFGGEHAKKVLISTYTNKNQKARSFILQRARDMNIEIIEGIDKMSREELTKALRIRAR